MTIADDQQVLILRRPREAGNFQYWMAELPDKEIEKWKQRIAQHDVPPPSEPSLTFGNPLTLNEVMTRLHVRNYQVLDYPGHS